VQSVPVNYDVTGLHLLSATATVDWF